MLPGLIHSMLFGGAEGAGGGPVTVQDDTIEAYAVAPADAVASITFRNTGMVTLDYGIAGGVYPYPWLLTGAAADFEISFDGGSAWLGLGTSRNLYQTRSMVGVGSSTYAVKIRTAAAHAIVAEASITLWLEVNT